MKSNKNNIKDFEHISGIINKILEVHRQETGDDLKNICRIWNNTVEKSVAENAQPFGLKGKILIVNVASSSWIQQLQFTKNDIISKINSSAGKELVEEIKFKIGTV
jgi:predicted nucleic acid-binding Zn ribbon protein